MGILTSDLSPRASGSASLGVEQVDGLGGFTTDIRPYAHVHQNSGVFHDPMVGTSGVIRFNAGTKSIEMSVDGGLTYPLLLGTNGSNLANDPQAAVVGSGDLSIIAQDEMYLEAVRGVMNWRAFGTLNFTSLTEGIQMSAMGEPPGGDIVLSANDGEVELISFGGSGVLTYRFGPFEAWHTPVGAGNPNLVPIPHSGHVAQMIASAGGTPHTLQAAYDGGNEILSNRNLAGNQGVLVGEAAGVDCPTDEDTLLNKGLTYGIAVSGFTPTPLDINSYAITTINPNNIVISSSGSDAGAPNFTSYNLFIGNAGDRQPRNFHISTSGILNLVVDNVEGNAHALNLTNIGANINIAGGTVDIDGASVNIDAQVLGVLHLEGGDVEIIADNSTGGDIDLTSTRDIIGIADRDITLTGERDMLLECIGEDPQDGIGTGGQLALEAFNASGRLEYRFGPHQSWYMKQTHSSTSGPFADGYNPLVASGAIIQMILENAGGGSTLQAAYDAGQTIFLDGPDMQIAAAGGKLKLSTDGDRAELNMSGLLDLPSTDREVGDISFVRHGAGFPSITVVSPADEDTARAQALGIGDVTINTASGVTNFILASGIGEFDGFGTQQNMNVAGTDVDFNWDRVNHDSAYLVNPTRDIVFLTPGWFKVTYGMSYDHSVGNTRSIIRVRATLNGSVVTRSTSYAYSRNTTAQESSCSRTFTINADPNDILIIQNATLDVGTQAGISAECCLLIERLGPKQDLIRNP